MTGQLALAATLPGAYWVRVVWSHVFATGTRLLVVRPWKDDWLLCWRDGVRPQPDKRLGTLLKREQVERV